MYASYIDYEQSVSIYLYILKSNAEATAAVALSTRLDFQSDDPYTNLQLF